jgi:hypothetical protein
VKSQKPLEDQKSDVDDMIERERVTNQEATKFIAGIDFILCGKAMSKVKL